MSRLKHPHVVIVGGGFAGLYAARGLARASVRVGGNGRHAGRDGGEWRWSAIFDTLIRVLPGSSFTKLGPRILPSYPEDLSSKARRHLEQLGVTICTRTTRTSVESVSAEGIVAGGKRLRSRTVTAWTDGGCSALGFPSCRATSYSIWL